MWAYAFLVGASPSVLRAVTLFSSFQLVHISHKRIPSSYMVLLSMIILLTINPNYIFQLGFQMSYLAVYGILFLTPLMHMQWRYKICRWFWELTTVSLSAQLAVAPLSIHHFHQFPGLFLLSNWVFLPIVGLFLYVCIICLILLFAFPLPDLLIRGVDLGVEMMNTFTLWVSKQEEFLLSNLTLDSASTYLCYAVLISVIARSHTKGKHYWALLIFSVLGVQWQIQHPFSRSKQTLWVGQVVGKSVLIEQNNRSLYFHSSDSFPPTHRFVKSFCSSIPHDTVLFLPLKNYYRIGNRSFYIVDGSWAMDIGYRSESTLIIRQNPKVNFEKLLQTAAPSFVIIDGSNTPFFIERWQKTMTELRIAHWITSKQGAYRFIHENVE